MKEKRIIAVVTETVQTPGGVVVQISGRMAAQACHAVSRMKMHRLIHYLFSKAFLRIVKRLFSRKTLLTAIADERITTLLLSCRDSNELEHVMLLLRRAKIEHYDFMDTNPPVYGPGDFRTAIATVPVEPERLVGVTDYLPLWVPK